MRPLVRLTLLLCLAASAAVPFALLVAASLGREWFYPALWPSRYTGDTWRAVAGGALAASAWQSVWLAALTGALGTLVALPVGRALATLRGWRRHVGAALAFLPVAAPPVALATGTQYFFLVLGLGGTTAGVLLAHLVPAVGYLSLYFLGVFLVFDPSAEDAARTLGAPPWAVFRRVTVPMLRRQVGEAWALGFLVSWAQVALTQLVGGGLVHTLSADVFAYVRSGQDSYAAAGALLLSVPPLIALSAAGLAARRASVAAL